jgi:hypothetical protein
MELMIQNDFGDRFSPMVVKELRQGLRSRVFVSMFLLIQGLMIFCVFLSLAAAANNASQDSANGVFWMINGVLFLVAMPCRGLNAHSGEIKGRTIELLLFTGLTPFRILIGKWKAIMAQTILVACTVLPYAVLRFFIGGVNLVADLESLGLLLVLSCVLGALAVAVSSFRSMFTKIFVFVVLLILSLIAIGGIETSDDKGGNLFLFIFVIPLGLMFLISVFSVVILRLITPSENVHHD